MKKAHLFFTLLFIAFQITIWQNSNHSEHIQFLEIFMLNILGMFVIILEILYHHNLVHKIVKIGKIEVNHDPFVFEMFLLY